MNGLKNYILNFEQIHIWIFYIKIKRVSGVTGDSRWPKDHPQITLELPGHTYPPKNLCAAFQMQYHKPSEPQRNETTQQKTGNIYGMM